MPIVTPEWMLRLVAVALVIATLLPMLRTDKWWVRILDFPRFQVGLVTAFVAAALTIVNWPLNWLDGTVAASAALACLWQLSWIWRYIPGTPREAPDTSGSSLEEASALSLMTSNVHRHNRDVVSLVRITRDADPDVLLAVETDEWWCARLGERLDARYRYKLAEPLSNGYGMVLFSRLELVDPEVRYLVDDSIPSIRTGIRLRSGAVIDVYGMHPMPPAPAQDSAERDTELHVVGKEISRRSRPAIVLGDLNDVAWSRTTSRFLHVGGLKDPRRGRGFFNTYPARMPGLRYPLDYIFHTTHFAVADMRVLPGYRSDHLPLIVRLVLMV